MLILCDYENSSENSVKMKYRIRWKNISLENKGICEYKSYLNLSVSSSKLKLDRTYLNLSRAIYVR